MKSLARSVIYIDSEIVELCHSTPLPKLPCIPGCYQRDRGHECMWVMPSFFKETGYSFFHPLTNGQAERLVQSFKKSCPGFSALSCGNRGWTICKSKEQKTESQSTLLYSFRKGCSFCMLQHSCMRSLAL